MRLSDAIALGRVLMKPLAGGHRDYSPEEGGCALDMALAAVGINEGWWHASEIWPWLMGRNPVLYCGMGITYASSIAVRFDEEQKYGRLNLDALIDYVRSVEPPEEEAPIHPCVAIEKVNQ